MAKNKPTKSRLVEVPDDFNLQLKKQVLEFEEQGIMTSVPELIMRYAKIGYNSELKEHNQ